MEVTKTTEEKLAEALAKLDAAETKGKQTEQALQAERDLRGKAEQELADTNVLVDQLNQAAAEPATDRKVPTAKLGTGASAKTYRIVAPQFNLAGFGVVKAEDVKDNSDVLKKLVEVGAGVIELVK